MYALKDDNQGLVATEEHSTPQGLPYDFESAMTIFRTTSARDESQVRIIPNPTSITSSPVLSKGRYYLDYLHIRLLYCEGICWKHFEQLTDGKIFGSPFYHPLVF